MGYATVDAVQAEGSFYKEQFNLATDLEFSGVLTERIAEAAAETQALVGDELYATSDTVTVRNLTTAEVYLATAKGFLTILNIMATWDAEALPSEFIDGEELQKIIDRYRDMALKLLEPYIDGVWSGARPYLSSGSITVSE